MVTATHKGYFGPCSALMLSAREELFDSKLDVQNFDWSRVSESDPRIQSSEWLEPTHGEPHINYIWFSYHLLSDDDDPVNNDRNACTLPPQLPSGESVANPEAKPLTPSTGKLVPLCYYQLTKSFVFEVVSSRGSEERLGSLVRSTYLFNNYGNAPN
jgi:hypothetical protein